MRAKASGDILVLPDADKDVDTGVGGGRRVFTAPPPLSNNDNDVTRGGEGRLQQYQQGGGTRRHPKYSSQAPNQENPYLSYVKEGSQPPLSDSPPPLPQLVFDSYPPQQPSSSVASRTSVGGEALIGSTFSFFETEETTPRKRRGGIEGGIVVSSASHYTRSSTTSHANTPLHENNNYNQQRFSIIDFNSNSEYKENVDRSPVRENSLGLSLIQQPTRSYQPQQPHPHYYSSHHGSKKSLLHEPTSNHTRSSSSNNNNTNNNNNSNTSRRRSSSSSASWSRLSRISYSSSSSATAAARSLLLLLGRASSSSTSLCGEEEVAAVVASLRRERSRLLKEIEQEDEERSAFYAHLESLNQRLRTLPQQYNVGCERYRVEGEMCRVQEALSERLGPPAVMLRRRDQRLHAINAIEKAIQRLRQENNNINYNNNNNSSNSSSNNQHHSFSTKTRNQGGSQRTSKEITGNSRGEEVRDEEKEEEHSRFYTASVMDLANANQLEQQDHSSFHLSPPPQDDPEQRMVKDDDSSLPPNFNNGESSATAENSTNLEEGENDSCDGAKINHPTIEAVLRGSWPFDKALWHSSPASVGISHKNGTPETTPGIMSTSSVTNRRAQSQQQLLTNKVEMVYGLLSMFSSGDRDDMSRTLLAMSSSPDSCVAMRQSGCLPLLIQLLHGTDDDTPPTREARLRAAQALHNIVHSHPDDKRGRREARVLRLLEQLRDYSDSLWEKLERLCAGRGPLLEDAMDRHPGPAMAALMKLSFDEEHRHAMCALGGLHAIAELIRRDHEAHGSSTADQYCTTLRRYAGMALTNLTFGDGTNKALLCSFRSFMKALVSQLHSPSEDLRQVTASVLRNLSWRADGSSKTSLREVGAVMALTEAALTAQKESTLKVILSAVWNLSAHCSMNKSDICSVDGALAFICSTLTYKSQSKTLSIIENGGGILRNISSHIAVRDDLRQVLRDQNTLNVLLGQLRSPSLTVVSNACGTLWNLSARCPQDQATLWRLGAVPMLRSLINSKHKMISMGSSAALKNLLQAKPEGMTFFDGRSGCGLGLPSLQARKQKALEQELDPSLAETCDNIETSPRASPTSAGGGGSGDGGDPMFHSLGHYGTNGILSDSRDSLLSTHSDKTHDRMQQMLLRHHNSVRESEVGTRGEAAPPDSPFDILSKYVTSQGANNSKSSLAAKVSSIGSKYLMNGKGAVGGGEEKPPTPRVNNFVKGKGDDEEDDDDEDVAAADQPTDFSLKYMEGDVEDEIDSQAVPVCSNSTSSSNAENSRNRHRTRKKPPKPPPSQNGVSHHYSIHDDSLKTFCTEGTPYNFSTATSLSDLREISNEEGVGSKEENFEELDLDLDSLKDIEGLEMTQKEEEKLRRKKLTSKSPAVTSSADKPVTYCVEDTPVSLSRISSMSSISSEEINERINDKDLLEDDEDEDDVTEPVVDVPRCLPPTIPPDVPKEHPTRVKVNVGESHPVVNSESHQTDDGGETGTPARVVTVSCDQTPLMFSRATSVSSLSSFDIQSIHDDGSSCRSSVVSEFSRVASGVVSPSDLPDSPSQTVPSSPKRRGAPRGLGRGGSPTQQQQHQHHHQQQQQQQQHGPPTSHHQQVFSTPQQSNIEGRHVVNSSGSSTGVFHDSSKAFNDEGTPIEFSHGTSLSSLTFDEEDFPARSRGDGKDSSTATTTTTTSDASQHEQQLWAHTSPQQQQQQQQQTTTRLSRDPVRSSIPRLHHHTRSQDPERRRGGREGSISSRTSSEGPHSRGEQGQQQEDDERRLAEVIKSGMPSSSSSTKKSSGKAPTAPPTSVAAPRVAALNRAGFLPPPPPPPPPPPAVGSLGSAIPIQTPNLQVTVQAFSLVDQPSDFHKDAGSSGGWSTGGDSVRGFCTEDTPANLSHAGSNSDLSQLSIPTSNGYGKSSGVDSDESIEGKKLLEKCIRSGMPKPKSNNLRPKEIGGSVSTTKESSSRPLLSPRRSPHHRPLPVARVIPAVKVGVVSPQLSANKSPSSAFSSPSNSSFPSEELKTYAVEGTPIEFSPAASLSDLTVDTPPQASSTSVKRYSKAVSREPKGNETPEMTKTFAVESNTPLDLSIENTNSTDRAKGEEVGGVGAPSTLLYSHNSSLSSLSIESDTNNTTTTTTPREEALLRKCINQGMPRGPTSRIPQAPCSRGGTSLPSRITPGVPMQHLHLSRPTSETIPPPPMTSEAESKKLFSENEESEKQRISRSRREEESSQRNENRRTPPLAPDNSSSPEEAKAPSLDEARTKMEKSTPSSGSIEMQSDTSLSESHVVMAEALKVAKAVSKEGSRQTASSDETSVMSASVASMSSACIDLIKPPSAMGSLLSLSTSSFEDGKTCKQPPAASVQKRMECRHTKKLPEMVRRALGDHQDLGVGHQGSEAASLASSCHSNIDNIFPPSLVEDDMESSMISVASITSEVVEPTKDSPPSGGISMMGSEVLSEIVAPARQLANLLQKEAQGTTSSLTLTAGGGGGADEASTYQEITDLDETIGPQHFEGNASDTEMAVDDLPHDVPDLPQDSPLRRIPGARGSPKFTSPLVRLSQRLEGEGNSASSVDSNKGASDSLSVPKTTPKQRRSDDVERFRTRTISCETPPPLPTNPDGEVDTEERKNPLGRIIPVQNENENLEEVVTTRKSFRQRRNENPSRYQTRTIEAPFKAPENNGGDDEIVEFHDGEDLCLTQEQLEVLSQDANIVICSLNETREAMTTSEVADFSEENILDIETLSLISNEDEDEILQLLGDGEEEEPEIKGPRIVKPGEERKRIIPSTEEQEPPSEKVVRGKRRALYSSGRNQSHHPPCSTKVAVGSKALASSSVTVTRNTTSSKPVSTSPKQPRATRASTLRQNNNNNNMSNTKSDDGSSKHGSSPGSSAGSSPKLWNASRPLPASGKTKSRESLLPIKRQNTFTKDDLEQSPPPPPDKGKKALSVPPKSKARVRRDAVQPSQSYPASAPGGDWTPRGRSNAQKSSSLTRDAIPPTAKDMAEWGVDQAHGKGAKGVAKKDVTSRIANLWKRVEKAQTSSKVSSKGKDDKVWISSGGGGAGKTPTPPSAPPPNRPLVRSSTFEKEGHNGKGRTSLGLKLSRLKGRDTRSSPPSEASTPVDSRPQCLVSPTRVTSRPRPSTHPSSATPRAAAAELPPSDDPKEKRLSRLGSFIVVEEEQQQQQESSRGRAAAVVAPFSYSETPLRASSITRIPQPSKALQNNPRDDNGNATVLQ